MPDITAKDVQRLRQATGAGMMDSKNALVEADGDFDRATTILREKGLASSAKRSDREAGDGAVAVAVTPAGAAIVELRCETDFVAKSEDFVNLVNQLAESLAGDGEAGLAKHESAVEDLKMTLKENISVGRTVRYESGDGTVLDAYLHRQSGRGKNAVLVELDGGSTELAHDVALHIASSRPRYLSRDDVPADEVEAERQTLETITRNEGKPEAAMEKIVEGRLRGYFKDLCLLEQGFVKDEKQTVGQILGDVKVNRFAQVEIGR
jgi:elongation factor Ts